VENLLPLESYFASPKFPLLRVALLAGIPFGAVMGLFVLLATVGTGGERPFATAGVLALGSGTIIGLVAPISVRSNLRSLVRKTYNGTPPFDTAPPAPAASTHRLPASFRRSRWVTVGGVLYAGRDGIAFVPHARNLPRDRQPIWMRAGEGLRIAAVPHRDLNVMARLLYGAAPPALEIAAPGGRRLFVVPQAEAMAAKLRAVLAGEELR
jgi:hypothetical protein